jgi:hypothetical protein
MPTHAKQGTCPNASLIKYQLLPKQLKNLQNFVHKKNATSLIMQEIYIF